MDFLHLSDFSGAYSHDNFSYNRIFEFYEVLKQTDFYEES